MVGQDWEKDLEVLWMFEQNGGSCIYILSRTVYVCVSNASELVVKQCPSVQVY